MLPRYPCAVPSDVVIRHFASAALVAAWLAATAGVLADADRDRRMEAIRSEIERLQLEMDALGRREATILGEVERLGSEIRLREAELAESEMLRVFNCGIGMVLIVAREKADDVIERLQGLGERSYRIGEIEAKGPEDPPLLLTTPTTDD